MKKGASASDQENDDFLRSTLHGTVDDIVKKKTQIDLKKVFDYGKKNSRKLVLVEGAPGVGKTMLALKIAKDWSNEEFLHEEFDIVLLAILRRFQGKSSVNLTDIVSISIEGDACKEATEALQRSLGKRVLFILEGWDELPPNLRADGSFFFDLVQGHKLPEASILVTSRPIASEDLYDYMDDRHIEVLGFKAEQIRDYVRSHGQDLVDDILDHLEKFPNLKALAHIPLTLSIICSVAGKTTLPKTLTELYRQHIFHTLMEHFKKAGDKRVKGLASFEELPKEEREVIEKISTLALDGFKRKAFVYSSEDLRKVAIDFQTKEFTGFGLLNSPPQSVLAGFKRIFQFNHLSIQEFLAANAITMLDHSEKVRLLESFRQDRQFRNIWKFFAGITRLEDEEFKKKIIDGTSRANQDQIFLAHCLYEANNPEISKRVAKKMQYKLNLSNMLLKVTDCLCAAHMITTAEGEWTVDLRGCNIGEDGLKIFKTTLLHHINKQGPNKLTLQQLNLTHNRLTMKSIAHLADIIRSDIRLKNICLSDNKFGNEGMKVLAAALKCNKTVTGLRLDECDLTVESANELALVLETGSTIIQGLYLAFEPLGPQGVTSLARSLEINCSLTELSLINCNMTSAGLAAIARMTSLNNTLKVLRLDRNGFGPDDCNRVAFIIASNNSLIHIDFSKNPIGDEGFEIIIIALITKPLSPIEKLGLFGCEITHKRLNKLVEYFAITEKFKEVLLGNNQIGDEGASVIGEALITNISKSVKHVRLEQTSISCQAKDKLQKICDSLNQEREEGNRLEVSYLTRSERVKVGKYNSFSLVSQCFM